jgi:hypothetical protein
VLSPDGYTILPIRPITTTITVAIFMVLQLDRNLHVVNAHPFSEARSSVPHRAQKYLVVRSLTAKSRRAPSSTESENLSVGTLDHVVKADPCKRRHIVQWQWETPRGAASIV